MVNYLSAKGLFYVSAVDKQCGKLNCKCFSDKTKRHGPYYLWTRKENSKTVTKTLNVAQLRKCKKAIKNMEKLNKYIKQLKKDSFARICNED